MGKHLWIKVSHDKYELPLAVGETLEELAEMCNTTKNAITTSRYHYHIGRIGFTPYRKVEIDDDEC